MEDKSTRIIKVKKNSEGDITDVMFENGEVYPIEEAIKMTKEGKVKGVNVGQAKNGRRFLRKNPNDDKSDNLDNLPTF